MTTDGSGSIAVRPSLGFLGVVAFGLAVATVLVPGLAAPLDVVGVVGNDYLFVVPLGVAATVVVLGLLASRSVRGVDQCAPPDPEGLPTADAPGEAFDRLVTGGWRSAPGAIRRRDWLHDRLRSVAVGTLMRKEGCARPTARRRIADGTWTDDPVAAAFLAAGPDEGRVSARELLLSVSNLEAPIQRRARRTARAVDRLGRDERT